jgi:hypothetical protein
MINAYVTTPVAVAAGANVIFTGSRARTNGSCYCNGGWLTHEDGSGKFLISRPGIYLVGVGAQVTSAVAGTDATLAITANGEALAGTAMAETITAADDVAQLATTALVRVPCGASITVGLANTGADEITINAASLTLIRVA